MAEAERRGDPQAAAEFGSGQDRLHSLVDLSADSCRMVVKRAAGFREGLTMGCSRQQMAPRSASSSSRRLAMHFETPSRRTAGDTPPASATSMKVRNSSTSNSAFLMARHSLT